MYWAGTGEGRNLFTTLYTHDNLQLDILKGHLSIVEECSMLVALNFGMLSVWCIPNKNVVIYYVISTFV